MIEDSVEKIEQGVKLVGRSEKTLDELMDSVKQVTAIVAEIAANAELQTSGIKTVNEAVSVLDSVTQKNASMVEQATSYSSKMEQQTAILSDQVNFFTFNKIVNEEDKVSAEVSVEAA